MVSNHQSHLDPPLVGMACHRHMNYIARETLFAFKPFAWLIHSINAIAIDREGLGLAGIKESLKRLKNGEMVLIFAEGTRTPDGEIKPFKPGITSLASIPFGDPARGHRRGVSMLAQDPDTAPPRQNPCPLRPPHPPRRI